MRGLLKALAVLAVVSLLLFAGLACGPKPQPKKKKSKPIPSKTVGLKQPITVGAFKYELLSSRETTIIGPPDQITSARSKGVFIVLHFQAELVGNTPRTLDRREIGIVDEKGKIYQSSQDAQGALTAQRKQNLFKQDTTYRGIAVNGWLAFDVDRKATGPRVRVINLMDPKSFMGYITLPPLSKPPAPAKPAVSATPSAPAKP